MATTEGGTGHPGTLCHKQPELERAIQTTLNNSYSKLRPECTVVGIEEDEEKVTATYTFNGTQNSISGRFLVGADGKTGFVRKKYLEPKGILMENLTG